MQKKTIFKIISCCLIAALVLLLVFAYTHLLPQPEADRDRASITILTYKNIPLSTLDGFHTEYPDYEINIERYPKENYLAFLETKLTQEGSVDIIELPTEAYLEYIEEDRLLPISSMALFTRIRQEALEYLQTLSGTSAYYGVPYQSDYLGIWYNVSLFEKYGLEPPDSLEHFLEACRLFSQEKISPLAVGLADSDAANNLLSLLTAESFSSASQPATAGTGFAGLDASACQEALQACYDMQEQRYLSEACFYMTNDQAFEAFLNSSYAMAVAPESSIAMINDGVLQQIDIGVCGFHISSGEAAGSVIGSPVDSVLCISSSSQNTDLCRVFLDYYTKYDTVFQYIDDTRTMTNLQNYTVDSKLAAAWARIKDQDCYVPEEHFYISPFVCDADTYALPRKLFCNLVTPQEFTAGLTS